MPYACKSKERLLGWYIVHKISPHAKLPLSNDEDYNFNTNTYDGEFFQEAGLQGTFTIDLTEAMEMEVENDDEDAGDEVVNEKDIQMLERFRLVEANEDDVPSSDTEEYLDMVDSDDDTYATDNPNDADYF
jgi:hypothetical protein